jgi:hypothetical protein
VKALHRVASRPRWSAKSNLLTACRLAVWAADDVLAVTGNLAAEGDLALQLLPGTSAAGLCAASASPQLVDGHRRIQVGVEWVRKDKTALNRSLCMSS